MVQSELSLQKVIGAPDIELGSHRENTFELCAGNRRYALAGDAGVYDSLRVVIEQIVPRILSSEPLGDQLSSAELDQLRPHFATLSKTGVLLNTECAIASAADRDLFAFIARRSQTPDRLYESIKRQPVRVSGAGRLAVQLRRDLEQQGLPVAGNAEPALSIAISYGDTAALYAHNKQQCAARRSSVSVLLQPHSVRIGPWTAPGESACMRCLPETESTVGSAAVPSWLSLQPSCVSWISGVIAYQTLRALVPVGADSPWGTLTGIDVLSMEQSQTRVWRDPYCQDCSTPAAQLHEWTDFR